MTYEKQISFFVNDLLYTVDNVDPRTTFNTWLRNQPGLTGTKVMCREGGCGCCVVALQRPSQGVIAANSCLLPLCSVDGCIITTVEGIGSRRSGFNPIQTKVGEYGASQCGYCTPGFVMSMHSLLQEESSPTQQRIEDNFDGHICRCTGYRSIFDAMKCFACDADPKVKETCQDIEDIKVQICSKKQPGAYLKARSFRISTDNVEWVRPTTFTELKTILKSSLVNHERYKIVCGNTGTGVFKTNEDFRLYIDISMVQEFLTVAENVSTLEFGAAVTLSRIILTLTKNSAGSINYEAISLHLKKVASYPVRNCGSWAGNVMLKHSHREFPSDVCVLLEVSASKLKVYDIAADTYSNHSVFGEDGIMNMDMTGKILTSVVVPNVKDDGRAKMKTFKVMPRSQVKDKILMKLVVVITFVIRQDENSVRSFIAQTGHNALAYVNAGFISSINTEKQEFLKSTLVFGGIAPDFSHAVKTEDYLAGKPINSNETLKGALQVLSSEIKPVCGDEYKNNLALGLLYKFYLSVCDNEILSPGVASGITNLVRPVSSGTQTFKPDPATYPVSQHIPKLSGQLQAAGEAYYLSDRPVTNDELHCDVVTSEIGNAHIDVIDISAAKQMEGFVQIISKDNFPPEVKNTYLFTLDPTQPIIATDYVSHAGQIVAVVIAKTATQASKIASAVKVTFKNPKKPIITNQDAIDQDSVYDLDIPVFEIGNPDEAISAAKHVISGEFNTGLQYHFYMETHVCRAECTEENGFNIELATQLQQFVQSTISYAFNVPCHKIEVTTKRVGGGYGGKGTYSQLTSCIASLAAYATNRPVRFHASLKTCLTALGSRVPYTMKYKLGFNGDGVMLGMDCTLYGNSGCSAYDGEMDDPTIILNFADSAFFCSNRRYKNIMLKSNLPSTTWCRAPASVQLTAFADMMIEHMASYLGKDPIDVKYSNLYKQGQPNLNGELLLYCNIRGVYDELLSKYEIRKRQNGIASFNEANLWKKKGLAVVPMKYRVPVGYPMYAVLISIYGQDGSVVVSHAGIELGQGINTKIAQTTAYKLGIPLSLIMVQRTSTISAANSAPTGGSLTSEAVCKSAIGCCDILNSRLKPIRDEMSGDVSWKDLIAKCAEENVDLNATYSSPSTSDAGYSSFGVTAAEVEYDVITGEHEVTQVDTVFDCGISLNPSVDIGQVEGAFIMGMGFWLSEQMIYDEENGQLLSDSTWTYHPPTSKDIPIVWNVDLLKDAPNPLGVLRSKACGEPPLCMSVSVALALKRAVEATKSDRGMHQYFSLPTPATVEALHNSSKLNPTNDFNL